MKCDVVQQELDAFVAGELLSPGAVQRVERHLEQCDVCRARANRQRRLDNLLADLVVVPVPDAFAPRVLAAARRRLLTNSAQTARSFPVRRLTTLDAVAAATLATGLTLGTWMAQHTWRLEDPAF